MKHSPQFKAEQYASSIYDVNQYTEPDSVKGTGWTDCRDAWLEGFNADRWIPAPKDVTELPMNTECIFLIPVRNNKLSIIYWDIIAGYIDPESYTEIRQTDDEDCGWTTESIAFYSIIGALPPLPKTPTL